MRLIYSTTAYIRVSINLAGLKIMSVIDSQRA